MNKSVGIFLKSGFGNLGLGSGSLPALIKCLDAHDIPITKIIGSSAGSFAVPLLASRQFSDASEAWLGLAPSNVSKFHPIKTMRHPFARPSLFDSGPLERYIAPYFSRHLDKIFSPSTIPFEIITTDLKTGETIFFLNSPENKSSLLNICMASAAIVPFFEPRNVNGRILIDGAFSNDMPIKRFIDSGCDVVFVVDIYRGHPPLFVDGDPKELNWPGLLTRSTQINIHQHTQLRLGLALAEQAKCKIVFVYPEIELHHVLFLDFFDQEMKEMLTEIGYWSAKKTLKELGLDSPNI